VYLVNNKKEFIKKCNELFKTNDTIICQEFIKTEYDWRIGILDKKPIFCCKYYMAQDDWKIIKYNRNGEYIDGKHETISISDIPEGLLKITNECLEFLGNGLYGLDIKEKDGKYYVIEINDNPSIDAGVEDEKEGDNLYKSIIMWFLNHPYNQEKIDRKIQIFYMNNNGVILHDKTSKEPKSKRISNISETL
ncbi:MAG TPA: hypothetical protein VKR58_04400, partial [Aquella sp.]|nr:hypothetical protein [Aquella sp.]